jgi:tripartite-type tricarboxylate transporter receptor subunit TctC
MRAPNRNARCLRHAIAVALGFAATSAQAADPAATYPNKPIRIMGQGAGSTADFLSRYVGQKLTEKWGQGVVVDNRAGAGGTIATDLVAKAAPDGYTLVMGHAGTHVSAPFLYKSLPYDPLKDFSPITRVTRGVTVLVIHPSVPANNALEFIAYAKKRGDVSYASAGPGTISHLTGELFNKVGRLKLVHIPYKSAGFALTALLGNETPVSFLSPITAHAQLKANRVRPLAVSSRTRFAGLPDVPSATEAGIPDMEAILWFGIFATGKTPPAIVKKLNAAVVEILTRPENRDMLLAQGAEAWPSTPDELQAWVKSELAKWGPIIKEAGITAN